MSVSSKEESLFDALSLREKVLLVLLAIGAVIETNLAEMSTPVSVGSAFRSLENEEFFRRKRTSSLSTISYLLAKRFILAKGRGEQRKYQLTEEGLGFLFAKFPKLKYLGKPWDGYWRFVFYDISEEEYRLRNRLRRELRSLGFKFVQRSVWLTPMPVEEELKFFLKREKLWGKILVLKSQVSAEENKEFLTKFKDHHLGSSSGSQQLVDGLLS